MASSQFIQRAYIAFFNRPADKEGYDYWRNYSGPDQDLLDLFAQSEEYLSDYAGKSGVEIIETIYKNLFGRLPDDEGWNYWEAQMNAGWVTVGNAAYAILGGAQGTDLTTINNKTTAAQAFTAALDTASEIVAYANAGANEMGHVTKDWLATVSYTNTSLSTAQANLDSVLTTLVDADLYISPPLPKETQLILSEDALQYLFPAACQYWLDVGAKAEQLDGIKFSVDFLNQYGRDVLAITIGQQIIFSYTTVFGSIFGSKWFVDSTPYSHEEFTGSAYTGFKALPGSAAIGNIDLLTVFIHEIGHIIGLGHDNLVGDYDVMAPSLSPGVRLLPTPANIASRLTGADYFTMDYNIESWLGNDDYADAYYGNTLPTTKALDTVQLIGYVNMGSEINFVENIDF
ncbi:MAG: DUF4214 domain-containing protein [Betaproteobacteria bacterium]|nr:DUF4214 domain-containing protein [Betaproteobacteria bacterium]